MGVDSLSMSLGNLLKVKWIIRTIAYGYARELLAEVLAMDNTQPVRKRLNRVLEEHGLGGLVRAGR
jgi:phosphotransferase system enzyme I (PtsP)